MKRYLVTYHTYAGEFVKLCIGDDELDNMTGWLIARRIYDYDVEIV